jgi:DUF4097 and DUF4098 domain-containing protein YvlB
MSNVKKVSIVALILLLTGSIGSLLTYRTNYQSVSVSEEKAINENITAVNIDTDNARVEIYPTKAVAAKVKLSGKRAADLKETFSAKAEGNSLSIKFREQPYKYINFGFIRSSWILKVYLPKKLYDTIQIENDNGHVQVKSLHVNYLKTTINNGEIEFNNISANDVDAETDNGKIHFTGNVSKKITGKTNNGEIYLRVPSIDLPIQLESNNGSISVQTEKEPANVTYDVHVDNGNINIFNKYTNGTVVGNGNNLIKLTTNNGKIAITK